MDLKYINGMGTLYDATEKQIAAKVEYNIHYSPQTKYALAEWYGNFVLEVNNVVSIGDDYILVLNDKRKGEIYINNVKRQSDTTIYYGFRGKGPLK